MGNDSAPSLPTLTLFVVHLQACDWFHWHSQKTLGKTRAQNQAFQDDLPIEHLHYRGSLAWMKDHNSVILSHIQQWKMGICRWIYKCTPPDSLENHGFNFNAFSEYSDNTIWGFPPPDNACSFLRLRICFFSSMLFLLVFLFGVKPGAQRKLIQCSLHFTSALHHDQSITFLTFSLFLQLAKQTWEANPVKDLRTDSLGTSNTG